jgi:hypothetical protein
VFDPTKWDKSLFAIRALADLGAQKAAWLPALRNALAAYQIPDPVNNNNPPVSLLTWYDPGPLPHLPSQPRFDFINAEIQYLLELMADDRDAYLPEIVAQADGAPFYWFSLLGLDPAQKPWTAAVMHIAVRYGEMVAMVLKYEYQRVRPSYVCPGLLPPFGPPEHPSFPSSHSTQAHLISLLLEQVSTNISNVFGPGGGNELKWLADRVAKNRERAGVHYQSDSIAGEVIATNLCNMLNSAATYPVYNDVLTRAQGEW